MTRAEYERYAEEAGKFLLRFVPIVGDYLCWEKSRDAAMMSFTRTLAAGNVIAGAAFGNPVSYIGGGIVYTAATILNEFHYDDIRSEE